MAQRDHNYKKEKSHQTKTRDVTRSLRPSELTQRHVDLHV